MLKPEYLFLWILFHLGAVELPKRVSERGQPKKPATELVTQMKFAEATTVYKNEKKLKVADEYRSLAKAFDQLGYSDTAFKLYQKLYKRFPKKITDDDALNFALIAKKTGNAILADSLIKNIKYGAYNGYPLFTQIENPDFLKGAEKTKSLNAAVEMYGVESKEDVYGLIKDPVSGDVYINVRREVESGLLNNQSEADGKPFSRIAKIKELSGSTVLTTELIDYQVWNKNMEITDMDSFGGMYVSVNIPLVNDQDIYVLNTRRLRYDPAKSKYVLDELGLDKYQYNSSGLVLNSTQTGAVFVSDMMGGNGKSDLWYSEVIWDKNGRPTLQNYYNLGAQLNTMLSDFDPCFITDDIIAFVSNGHMGMGGSDIYFYSFMNQTLVHAGNKVNSRYNEITPRFYDGKLYFSSDRVGNTMKLFSMPLDITKLENLMLPEPVSEFAVEETYVDNYSDGNNGAGSGGGFSEEDLENVRKSVTFDEVRARFKQNDPRKYQYTRGLDFLMMPDSVRLRLINESDSTADYRDFKFMTLFHPEGDIVIEDIFKRELDLLATLLKKNVKFGVDIRSYTDSRGSKYTNRRLSSNRAKFVKEYLEKIGVDKSQITTRGMGEDLLLNHCDDGSPCTEEEHRQNRRTELILFMR